LYPIYIAWLSKWFGERARKVGALMFALAAAALPQCLRWSASFSRYAGSLRHRPAGFRSVGCAVMLAVVGFYCAPTPAELKR